MIRRSVLRSMHVTGLVLVVLLLAGSNLKADQYTVTYGSGPGVSVSYTNPFPPPADVLNQGTMAVPFSVTDNTTSSSFTGFCIDLYHDQYNNQTYTAPAGTLTSISSTTLSAFFPYTAYTSDLVSRLNYLGYVYNQLVVSGIIGDQDVVGAVQLAIWSSIDKNFSYTTGDSNLQADTTIITNLMGTAGQNGLGGSNQSINFTLSNGSPSVAVTLSAYSTTGDYSGENGQLILIHPTPQSPGYNQNVITWGQNITITSINPEPSSFAIAGLGALGLIGYGLRRRSRA